MTDLKEVCYEILRRMYRETEPRTLDNPIEYFKENDDFQDFILPEKRQREIIDEVCDEYRVSRYEKEAVKTEVHLGLPSPRFKGGSE